MLPHSSFRIIDPSRFFFCFRAFRTKTKGAELFVGRFTEQISLRIGLLPSIPLQAGVTEQFNAEQPETTHGEALTHNAISSLPQKHFSIP